MSEDFSFAGPDYLYGRGRVTFSERLVDGLKNTPWWLVSAVMHAALIVLLTNMTFSQQVAPEEELVITTGLEDEEEEKIEMPKEELQDVLEELQQVDTELVIQSPVLVQEQVSDAPIDDIPIEVAEFSDVEPAERMETEIISVPQDVGIVVKDLATIGLGADGFIPRGATTYKKIIGSLTQRAQKKAKKYDGRILLIWLIDASLSMQDDQQEIERRLADMYSQLTEGEEGKLMMSIVRFGEKSSLWLEPTTDLEKTIDAFKVIPPDKTGKENCMEAVLFCADAFGGFKGRKKMIVLVTDETGNDHRRVEEALQFCQKEKITVFVIGREASLSSNRGYEPYWDEDTVKFSINGSFRSDLERRELTDDLKKTLTERGISLPEGSRIGTRYAGHIWSIRAGEKTYVLRKQGKKLMVYEQGAQRVGYTERGPESAELEMPWVGWGTWMDRNRILSGFGIYGQSRLAYYTGGAYYILDPWTKDEEPTPDPESEQKDPTKMDYEIMQLYKPELISLEQYRTTVGDSIFKKRMDEVAHTWRHSIPVRTHAFKKSDVSKIIDNAERKIKQADELLRRLLAVQVPKDKIERLKMSRRWIAHLDLLIAQFTLAKHRLRQYSMSLREFRGKGFFKQSKLYTTHGHGKVYESKRVTRDQEDIDRAFKDVIDRHPGTCWAMAAASFKPGHYHSYRFRIWVPPPPGAPPSKGPPPI